MSVVAEFFVILLVIAVSLLVAFIFSKPVQKTKNKLKPFAILLITNHLPATKAFLEYYASQIAWMDSEILTCMFLVYPEENLNAKALCEDMSREHEFFIAYSMKELQNMLDGELKNLEIS
ncbi:MAG: hypothetical protein K2J88_02290 [Oscillospiraceae bacterium]|nr:hypothetical protein [Oscillospiraceae bacterium]